jgi:hypothetical protein
MSETRPPTTTTDAGIPAASDEYSLTVGPSGPTAWYDAYVAATPHVGAPRICPQRGCLR